MVVKVQKNRPINMSKLSKTHSTRSNSMNRKIRKCILLPQKWYRSKVKICLNLERATHKSKNQPKAFNRKNRKQKLLPLRFLKENKVQKNK